MISHDLFQHIRLIVGMIMSLALARLLNGSARFIQHPTKVKVYPVHIGWVFTLLLFLVHFWWWEFRLEDIQNWTFETYLLIVSYVISFFLLSTLLFPDDMSEYAGFEDYFKSRRKWFFAILAVTFVLDTFDGLVKGPSYIAHLGLEFPWRNVVSVVLCVAAMFIRSEAFQIGFVAVTLLYELSWIFRLYHTVQ